MMKYEYKFSNTIQFNHSEPHTSICKSLAKALAYQLGLDNSQVKAVKGNGVVYVFFVKDNILRTITIDRYYAAFSTRQIEELAEFMRNIKD